MQQQHQKAQGLERKAQATAEHLVSNAGSSTPPSSKCKIRELRAERFMLQNSARDLLLWRGKEANYEYPANYHRTAKCLHVRHQPQVDVHQSKTNGKAFYSGLVVCGNVWACPVCAAKIQERRRLEIAQAFDWAYMQGKKVIMVTFTFPHYHWQRLNDLLVMQADAYTRLRRGNPWARIKTSIGYVGLIRSLEVTLGDSGWHPHTHEAWIVDKDADIEALRLRVVQRWLSMCQKVGLVPDNKVAAFLLRAVQITDNCSTSDYLAKQDDSRHWGADRELAKASSKTSKSLKGFHPFGLLKEHAEGSITRKDAGSRYLEYVNAMRGKSQLFWSHGLKDLVGINDKSDEEVATEQEDQADQLASLNSSDWALVIKFEGKTKILDLAETVGLNGIQAWLSDKRKQISNDQRNLATELLSAKPVPTESLGLKRRVSSSGPALPDPFG